MSGCRRRTPRNVPQKLNYFTDSDASHNSDNSDNETSILDLLIAAANALPKSGRRRSLPTKKRACSRKSPKKPSKSTTRRNPAARKSTSTKPCTSTSSTVNVDIDNVVEVHDEVEEVVLDEKQVLIIQSKVDDFFKSGNLVSDDDEEIVLVSQRKDGGSASTENKKQITYNLSDSSDDEIVINNDSIDSINTSNVAGPSAIKTIDLLSNSINDTKKKDDIEDIMEYIDTIIPESSSQSDVVNVEEKNDFESWEEYRKQTEEMIKSSMSLLNGIQEKSKPEEKSEKVQVPPTSPQKGQTCPICLETLGGQRPASATFCGHIFCRDCITTVAKTIKKCPTCRKVINLKKIHALYL